MLFVLEESLKEAPDYSTEHRLFTNICPDWFFTQFNQVKLPIVFAPGFVLTFSTSCHLSLRNFKRAHLG
jgi:hypothetical protein